MRAFIRPSTTDSQWLSGMNLVWKANSALSEVLLQDIRCLPIQLKTNIWVGSGVFPTFLCLLLVKQAISGGACPANTQLGYYTALCWQVRVTKDYSHSWKEMSLFVLIFVEYLLGTQLEACTLGQGWIRVAPKDSPVYPACLVHCYLLIDLALQIIH